MAGVPPSSASAQLPVCHCSRGGGGADRRQGMPPARHYRVSRSEPELARGEPGAFYASADLGERGLAAGGGVITERGEAAVIVAAEPGRLDAGGGFQHPVPDLPGVSTRGLIGSMTPTKMRCPAL